MSATSRQPLSIVNAWSRVRDLDDLDRALVARLALVGRVRDGPWDRVVLLAVHDEERAALGFLVSTLASVPGLRFAAAPWKSGSPGVGTAKVS